MRSRHVARLAAGLVATLVLGTGTASAERIGWWTFNEGGGTTAFDGSTNASHGVVIGAEYVPSPGAAGFALAFEPGDEVVIEDPVGPPDHLNINGSPAAYSISVWLRIDDFSGFAREPGIGKVNYNYGIAFYTGGARVNAYTGSGGNRVRSDAGGAGPELFTTGVWHHLVATYDNGAPGTNYFLYLDGALVHGIESSADPIDADGTPFTIGRDFTTVSNTLSFAGMIDELAVYDTALSAAAVSNLYAAGPATIDDVVIDVVTTGDTMGLTFTSQTGTTYRLDATPDLVNSNDWSSTGAFAEGTGVGMVLYDPAGFDTNRLYRVVVVPDP